MNLFENTFKKHVKLVNEHLSEGRLFRPNQSSELYRSFKSNPHFVEVIANMAKTLTQEKFKSYLAKWDAAYANYQKAKGRGDDQSLMNASDNLEAVYNSLPAHFGLPDEFSQDVLIGGSGSWTDKELENDIANWFELWGVEV